MLEHGFVDAIVKRRELPETIAKLVRLHGGEVADENIAKIVREAREQSRLTARFCQWVFDEFIELHGDRSFRDDGAVIG